MFFDITGGDIDRIILDKDSLSTKIVIQYTCSKFERCVLLKERMIKYRYDFGPTIKAL